jgi:rubredoxin
MPNLKVEVLPPILIKGLPREKDYAALDALAETIRQKCEEVAPQQKSVEISKEAAAPNRELAPPAETRYLCPVCQYVYDPAKGDPAGGIPPGTPFEKIPDDWICPICRVAKSMFKPIPETPAGGKR